MKALSTRVAALLAVAATLTLFAFVMATQPQQHVQIGLTAQAGDVQSLDDDDDDATSNDLVELQQEEDEQEAEQQNEAAQQQVQLDEQLASQ